jgi:acyl carrier protein phosphodiesterase
LNYLAHLALSGDDAEIITGNLMGDFLTRKQLADKPVNFQVGYNLHIYIDQYTDTHRDVDEVINLFKNNHGKYASVISDIVFDYFLAINWSEFYSTDFDSFELDMYNKLGEQTHLLPEKIRHHILRMIQGQFIKSYTSLYGLQFVLERMDKRASFPAKFVEAINIVKNEEKFINEKFLSFYKNLKEETNTKLLSLQNGMIL